MKRELSLDINGEQITVLAERDGDAVVIERDGQRFRVRVLGDSPAGIQSAAAQPTGSAALVTPARMGSGSVDVASPMTGVVDQVSVASGQVVSEGQVLVVLEAMKMYIDVVAPAAGVVADIGVAAGDSVKDGFVLVRLDAAGE